MQEIYSLTKATKSTIKKHVTAVANAWDKSERHVYKILAEEANDPFAMFLSMYDAVLDAGLSTTLFDGEMEFRRHRTERKFPAQLKDALNRAVKRHGELVEHCIESMSDGVWSLEEIDDAETKVAALIEHATLLLQGFRQLRERAEKHGPVPCDERPNVAPIGRGR